MSRAKVRRALAALIFAISAAPFFVAGCPNQSAPLPGSLEVGLQLVAEGLTAPVKLVAPPDGSGRLFVADQAGLIRVIDAGGNLLSIPFLDVRDRMITLSPAYDERGLLGLALHPGYAANGRFFVFYTAPKGGGVPAEFDSETYISEFRVTADANVADPAGERVILAIPKPQGNHNGGDIAFGPDGLFYIATGDGGSAGDIGAGHTVGIGNAQDKSSLHGKILRIDVDGANPYAIPPDNPFVGQAGARGEVFAYGLRNPYRMAFDSGGGRRLFAGDVGQNLFEEVDIITRGGNYGWNRREAAHCFDPSNSGAPPANCPDTAADGAPLVDPILEYPHNDPSGGPRGISVIGGFVYRGAAIASLGAKYVFGDWSSGFLGGSGSLFDATEQADGSWTFAELSVAGSANGRLNRFILGFGQDAAGELYVLTNDNSGPSGTTGRVLKLVPP